VPEKLGHATTSNHYVVPMSTMDELVMFVVCLITPGQEVGVCMGTYCVEAKEMVCAALPLQLVLEHPLWMSLRHLQRQHIRSTHCADICGRQCCLPRAQHVRHVLSSMFCSGEQQQTQSCATLLLQGLPGKSLKEALEDSLEEERKAVRNFLVCFFDEVCSLRVDPEVSLH
jgi:hypothetical protein